MKTLFSTLTSAAVAIGVINGCSQERQAGDRDNGSQTQAFALIVKNTGNPYNEREAEGFKNAMNELGHEAIVKAPAQPTAEAQIQMIEQLIIQRVAAIAIAGNDPDALQPALVKAMNSGIKVLSLDSAVNPQSRMVHVNQADPERIGRTLVKAMAEMIGDKGQIAMLSATSQADNQNTWIKWMKKELEENHPDMDLVKVAYGDDLRDKSVSETEALLKTYPELKGIIAPTTVAVAAAAKVIKDKDLKGQVQLTGLGLPSEMAEYITSGICRKMFLWNPLDAGYLAGYAADALVSGEITGTPGETFEAGDLGTKKVIKVGDGTEIMLGDPFEFNAENIDQWKSVY